MNIVNSDFDFVQKRKMSKLTHKIVLFIEPNDDACITPIKIGHLIMNRFAIDEDSSFEIVKVLELEKSAGMASSNPKDESFANEIKQKGIDLIRDEK